MFGPLLYLRKDAKRLSQICALSNVRRGTPAHMAHACRNADGAETLDADDMAAETQLRSPPTSQTGVRRTEVSKQQVVNR